MVPVEFDSDDGIEEEEEDEEEEESPRGLYPLVGDSEECVKGELYGENRSVQVKRVRNMR